MESIFFGNLCHLQKLQNSTITMVNTNAVCTHICMFLCTHVCMVQYSMHTCMYAHMNVCMHVYMVHRHVYVCTYVHMYVCMYACMHACMHVRKYKEYILLSTDDVGVGEGTNVVAVETLC